MSKKKGGKRNDRRGLIFLSLIVLANILFLNHYFPIRELFNQNLMTTTDYPYHYTDIAFFRQMPSTDVIRLTYLGDLKIASLFFFFAPIVSLQKWYVFLALASFPILFYLAGNAIYQKKTRAFALAIIGLLLVNFGYWTKNFLSWGLFPFTFSCAVFLVSIAYLYAFFSRGNWKNLIIGIIFALWALIIHPLTLFYLMLLLISLIIAFRQKYFYLIFPLIAVIFIMPMLFHMPASEFNQSMGWQTLKQQLAQPETNLLLSLSILGLLFGFKRKEKIFWAIYVVLLFIFIFFMSMIPMFRGFQIMRAIPLIFIFAAIGIMAFDKKKLIIIIAVLLIILNVSHYFSSYKSVYDLKLAFGLNNDTMHLKEYLEARKGNVWIEHSSWKTGHYYGEGHIQGYVAYWLYPKEVLMSSLRTDHSLRHSFYYCDGELNETFINETGGKQIFDNVVNRYNLSYVVYWSNYSLQFFKPYNKTCFEKICVAETGIKG